METDLKKYDEITYMESLIEEIIKRYDLSTTLIVHNDKENQILYYLTIITILYKEKLFNTEIENKTKNTKLYVDYSNLNLEIDTINLLLSNCIQKKELEYAMKIIIENGEEIKYLLNRFYLRNNKNYILSKEPMTLIKKHEKEQELLKINPFLINQCLLYNTNPMTEKEKIICDIIDYLYITNLNDIQNQGKVMEYIKELMINNYNEKQLEQAILFIIGTVYQEALEKDIIELTHELRFIYENPEVSNEKIYKYFKTDKSFSKRILTVFLIFISNIKEGKIEELENRTSYNCVKKRLKK